jgi:hypothetical protein
MIRVKMRIVHSKKADYYVVLDPITFLAIAFVASIVATDARHLTGQELCSKPVADAWSVTNVSLLKYYFI